MNNVLFLENIVTNFHKTKNKKIYCKYTYFREFIAKGIIHIKQNNIRYKIVNKSIKIENKTETTLLFDNKDFNIIMATIFKDWIKDFCKNKDKVNDFFSIQKIEQIKTKKRIFLLVILLIPFVLFFKPENIFSVCFMFFFDISLLVRNFFAIKGFIDFVKTRQQKKETMFFQENQCNQKKLPVYTILIPLYKENKVIDQILDSALKINYPKDLLDIKLVIEEDDDITKNSLTKYDFSKYSYIDVVCVPYFEPRTKPKALNYAILFAKGSLVTVFDAEDVFDKDQMMKSVHKFQKSDKNLFAIQARLSYYNKNDNLLSFFFNIEYLCWFYFFIKGMSSVVSFIPLGGSSNHFRYELLEKVGFWDSYNVTEDLEIAIRALNMGFKIGILDSDTKEWAVNNLYGWIKQRTRWIKGYLLTYFFYTTNNLRKSNWRSQLIIHLIIGNIFFFYVIYNVLVVIYLSKVFGVLLHLKNSVLFDFHIVVFYVYFIMSVMLYSVSCYIDYKKNSINKKSIFYLNIILYPLYFLLHPIAVYKAIYEIFKKPFYWDKTEHPSIAS